MTEGGAIARSFGPTLRPRGWSFPMRNVTMSGMGVGTVVVEASNTSGAQDAGSPCAGSTVTRSSSSSRSSCTKMGSANTPIDRGATVVQSVDDVLAPARHGAAPCRTAHAHVRPRPRVATVEEFTDPHLGTYTPPPPPGPGVWDVCHGLAESRLTHAAGAATSSTESVSHPLELIVPISLYRVGEQLHTVLEGLQAKPVPSASVSATSTRWPRSFTAFSASHPDVHRAGRRRRVGHGHDRAVEDAAPSPSSPRASHKLGKASGPFVGLSSPPISPSTIDRVYGDDRGFKTIEDVSGSDAFC